MTMKVRFSGDSATDLSNRPLLFSPTVSVKPQEPQLISQADL